MVKSKIFSRYKGKKVYVKLSSDRVYIGVIRFLDDLSGKNYIGLIDNKRRRVSFPENEISLIQEEL